MSDFRDAQNHAHPNKTNTLLLGIIGMIVGILILQIWLLTASLNTTLEGEGGIAWPAFYASLALFLGGCGLLHYLPDPLRLPVVQEQESFENAGLAWRTLLISSVSLALAFSVWFMWSAIAVKLEPSGFKISQEQKFWLIAAPVILGSLLRIPYGLIVSRFGSRNAYSSVTLLMLLPCLATGYILQNPSSPYWLLVMCSALTGIAGANFSTSMGVVTLWFPKKMQGTALGINGLGNLGVTVAQFSIPAVIGLAVFGGISGAPLTLSLKSGTQTPVYLSSAAYLWIPFILVCSAAIWFGTENFPQQPKTLASQLVICRRPHTWLLSYLYFLTFGAFVAMGASLPLIIQQVFSKAPQGAPDPLFFAPFAVLVATFTRPLGGSLADKFGAGRITAIAIGLMSVCGFSLSHFLEPGSFRGFFTTIMILCAAAGLGNGSIFKMIPAVCRAEAGPAIGVISCMGALGGFFPPLMLGWCIAHLGSPAWAYTAMALFGLSCFVINWWYYWRPQSPTHC